MPVQPSAPPGAKGSRIVERWYVLMSKPRQERRLEEKEVPLADLEAA